MKKTGLIMLVAFLLFFLDIGLTIFHMGLSYHLVSEGNPLIHYESGLYLLLANAIYILLVFLAALYLRFYRTIVIEAKNAKDYTLKLYQSDDARFIIACACFSIVLCTFVSRSYAVLDWVLFTIFHEAFFSSFYFGLRDLMPFQRFDIIMGFVSLFVVIPLFFKLEYEQSKQKI